MKYMTPRERINNALNHIETDQLPIDFGGTKSTGIHVDEYIEVADALGLEIGLPRVYDQFQMLAHVDEPMLSRFQSDVVQLENVYESWGIQNSDWKEWVTGGGHKVLVPGTFDPVLDDDGYMILREQGKKVAYMPEKNGLYFERYNDPAAATSTDDHLMPPEEWKNKIALYTDEELKTLEKRAQVLHCYTDYSISGGFAKLKMTSTGIFAGHEFTEWLMRLFTDPEYVNEILAATAECAIENLKLYLEAVGPYIDTIFVSTTDYGTQKCELFNPDIFRDLYLPNLKKINDFIHENCKAKTLYHSCGSIRNILGYMIEAGIDAINPVQTTAENMDPLDLKTTFGDKIAFWGGGINSQTTLQFGSPEEVRAEVRERIDVFGKGGGFIFNPVHNIQYGVKPENVIALFDEAILYGNRQLG
jgi:uroporphyrinogen decarboxylase